MRVVVINTGTELLLGDVVNSHLAFIAREIFPLGLRVDRQVTVPDGPDIATAIEEAFRRCDILFVTGGLGPTTDDVTREAVAGILGLPLRRDEQVMAAIAARIKAHRFQMTDRIPRQADVPEGATVLPNENGTAPGFYLAANVSPRVASPHIFVLPGPPRELEPMFDASAIPILRAIIGSASAPFAFRSYEIAGIGESLVERAVGGAILAIANLEVGYCARPGDVTLRVIGEPAAVETADAIVKQRLGSAIYSDHGEDIEEVVVNLLAAREQTLATAESCTGGYLAHRITNVPGASAVFLAGYVTYSNAMKSEQLGVPEQLIAEFGAVSEPVARAMAEGALQSCDASYAIATTGIAGPAGGSDVKPVGTVFIAIAGVDGETTVRRFLFRSDRPTFKHTAAQTGLNMLRERLLRIED